MLSMLESTLKECDKEGVTVVINKKISLVESINPDYFELIDTAIKVDYSDIWLCFRNNKDVFRIKDKNEEEQTKFILGLFLILVTAVNDFIFSMGAYKDDGLKGLYIDMEEELKYTLDDYFVDTDREIIKEYSNMSSFEDIILMYGLTETTHNVLTDLTRVGECRSDHISHNLIYKFEISSDYKIIKAIYH